MNALKFDAENRENPVTGYVYSYDGDDHRVEKNNAGSITYYWYDDNFTVIATTGALVRDNVYFNGRRVAYFSPGSGNQHYYWQDHLGSASEMSNSNGSTIEWESDNYPFGTPRVINNGLENHFRFTGYEHDPETGYYYADYREQSPNLGRFFSPDPLFGNPSKPQSLNRYTYVLNNPTNLVDPFGLDSSMCVPTPLGTFCQVTGDPISSLGGGTVGGDRRLGPVYARPRKTPPPPKFTLTIRLPNQSFKQCMDANANTYSIGGSIELGINVATGTNTSISSNPFVGAVTGNSINTFFFGSTTDAGLGMAANSPGLVEGAMGKSLSYGRNSSDITALNIARKGGLPLSLSRASTAGIKEGLASAGKALSLGLSFLERTAVDAGFTAAEAINCF